MPKSIPYYALFNARISNSAYLSRFDVQTVGGAMHTEYWIPAEGLPEFNANIVGLIEVIESFEAVKCAPR
jgi:hypothetical protein